MSLPCAAVRERLAAGRTDGVGPHLEACPGCAEIAARWDAARAALAEPPAAVAPDGGFARRVAARLETGDATLGWAAVRAFPVAVAVALVLGVWLWLAPGPDGDAAGGSLPDELASWVVAADGGAP